MGGIGYLTNLMVSVVQQIATGFIEFFNTIPILFENIGTWANNLFPEDFTIYIGFLVPIIITLVAIKFVKG